MAALCRSMRIAKKIFDIRPSRIIVLRNSCVLQTFAGVNDSFDKFSNLQQNVAKYSTTNQQTIASERSTQSHESSGTQEESKKDGKEEAHHAAKWQKIGFAIFGSSFVLMAGTVVYMWALPGIDAEGNLIPDEFIHLPTLEQYYKRFIWNLSKQKKEIEEPSRSKLLPDPVQYPYVQPPFTLVLEMTGILVHPEWTYNTGWRFKKRPGIDYFLQQVAPPYFEVVVYTSETGLTGDPLLTTLDPNNFITYRLYRDATRYMNSHHVKDLSCLNRDLSKVIFIDHDPKSYELNPRNAFKLKKWKGEDGDRTLYDLGSFLRAIVQTGVGDVREVLDYYSQFDDPLEAFKENQRKLQDEQERQAKLVQEQKKPSFGLGGIFGKK